MANKSLFASLTGKLLGKTDSVNHEGAPAYRFSDKHVLAQYAATGCLNSTFYASAGEQLDSVLKICEKVESSFVAKTAIYSRQQGYMKDMPALLCALLSSNSPEYLPVVFDRVIDNGRMLRNFVQIVRSGVVGRKSFGTMPKRLIRDWLDKHSDEQIFNYSVGNDPSITDIIKMVHPKAGTRTRNALYGYLVKGEVDYGSLPLVVQQYEEFKKDPDRPVPNVSFQMLTSLELNDEQWKMIARRAGWQMTRMNINTFIRHGVFKDKSLVDMVAKRLSDKGEIEKAKVFPYQLMVAHSMADEKTPGKILQALEMAMETAASNVPEIDGKVYVCPDVSGSMTFSSATGYRKGATSAVRCIDIAALVAAAVLRKNRESEVLPFEERVVNVKISRKESVMTNARKLSKIGGGGTNCSAPLKQLNKKRAKGDLVIFVSDNQSWVDARGSYAGTAMMMEWKKFKQRNPEAGLVCLDIQPYNTTQAYDDDNILNIGGFSDNVFTVISKFAQRRLQGNHWVDDINSIQL